MRTAARAFVVVTAALTAALGLGTAACVLLDPVPELQKPPRRAPAIVKTGAFPDTTRPLLAMPAEFVVPVRVPDPSEDFVWGFFVDWDVARPPLGRNGRVAGSAASKDLTAIVVDGADVATFIDPTRCHRFEFVVSLAWDDGVHQSDPAVTDSISWWYVPDGAGDCRLFDASAPEAGPPSDAARLDGATVL